MFPRDIETVQLEKWDDLCDERRELEKWDDLCDERRELEKWEMMTCVMRGEN